MINKMLPINFAKLVIMLAASLVPVGWSGYAQALYVPGGGVGTSSNSNVGIGTTSPRDKLTVEGNIFANGRLWSSMGSNEGGSLALETPIKTGATASTWVLYNMTGPYGNGLSFWRYYANGANVGPSVWFDDNGNVGIGTKSPGAQLQLGDSFNGMPSNTKIFINSGGLSSFGRFVISPDGNGAVGAVISGYFDGPTLSQRLHLGTIGYSGVEQTMTLQNGNVGIGTASPSHKLTVSGTIRAKEVIVDTGWADYVFADDYRLAPLSEVEAHIKEHKHLPDMPSAAQVAEKGISMGEMQAKLLAKVEELTLHVIEQQKRLQAYQAKIEMLETEVACLSARD